VHEVLSSKIYTEGNTPLNDIMDFQTSLVGGVHDADGAQALREQGLLLANVASERDRLAKDVKTRQENIEILEAKMEALPQTMAQRDALKIKLLRAKKALAKVEREKDHVWDHLNETLKIKEELAAAKASLLSQVDTLDEELKQTNGTLHEKTGELEASQENSTLLSSQVILIQKQEDLVKSQLAQASAMLDEMKPQLAKCIESEKHLGELEIQNASNTHELIKCHDDNKNMQERIQKDNATLVDWVIKDDANTANLKKCVDHTTQLEQDLKMAQAAEAEAKEIVDNVRIENKKCEKEKTSQAAMLQEISDRMKAADAAEEEKFNRGGRGPIEHCSRCRALRQRVKPRLRQASGSGSERVYPRFREACCPG